MVDGYGCCIVKVASDGVLFDGGVDHGSTMCKVQGAACHFFFPVTIICIG